MVTQHTKSPAPLEIAECKRLQTPRLRNIARTSEESAFQNKVKYKFTKINNNSMKTSI